MHILALLQGIPEPPPLNPIARWTWVFPVVESIHICGMALLVGTIMFLDLRLLGLTFKGQPISKVARQLSPWIRIGLIIMLTTGPYLFTSDITDYPHVTAFRVKMCLLAIALLFHFLVIRRAVAPSSDDEPLGWRRPAAVLSLALWVSVALGGLWIGNL